ncbi:uncharacterized protein LOC123672239 [Harmonia axyridis]|uniref:uncharacterized protein LOC123672239 n=1 Tax=Harmonia axyridis TaxID=115357 RepID=UPI001E279B01|nr:uncharacterized protein LOC123672239 [Harmonia axyridis]
MPYAEGYRYCLTCVDRFTRWPEAIPLQNQEASTIAKEFYTNWIARFGTPLRITTDQGRQFESSLFNELCKLTGTNHIRTTAYHPAANGMVERIHRQLKAAIKCHNNDRWTETLPSVLLGMRAAWRDDMKATAAEMVYGEPLRLPGGFLSTSTDDGADTADFVVDLRQQIRRIRPINANHHGERPSFVFKELDTSPFVFVRHEGPKLGLQKPYDGPYEVLRRDPKHFIKINDKETTVTIDRLKPAYIFDNLENEEHEEDHTEDPVENEANDQAIFPETRKTRSGRKVHFPKKYLTMIS